MIGGLESSMSLRLSAGKLAIATLLPILSMGSSLLTAATVEAVRLWHAPDHTRLVLDLSDSVSYHVFNLDNPERLVVDISDSRFQADLSQLDGHAVLHVFGRYSGVVLPESNCLTGPTRCRLLAGECTAWMPMFSQVVLVAGLFSTELLVRRT